MWFAPYCFLISPGDHDDELDLEREVLHFLTRPETEKKNINFGWVKPHDWRQYILLYTMIIYDSWVKEDGHD